MNLNYLTVRICLLLVLFIGTGQLFGQEQEPKAPTTIAELQSALEAILLETNTPAVGLTLVNKDGEVWTKSLGKANIEKNTVVDENTMFRIGSISKMYVSLAILKLQEEGRLSLKDKVRDLIPEIEFDNPWENTAPILIEHLLEHTTGWDDIHLTEYAYNIPNTSLKDGLDFHPHSRTSRWIPGTRMSYSNSGPPVAAYIVEKITGKRFEEYILENFFQPMGMETMTYFESEDYMQFGATLYADGKAEDYWNIIMRPSGAINATPKDMAKMVKFFINRGRMDSLQILNEASLRRMETPTTTIGAKAGLEYGYGLSNSSSPQKGFVFRRHTGGVNGGLAELAYLPDYNVGYAFMINSGNSAAFERIIKLVRDFLIKDLQNEKVDLKPLVAMKEVAISGYYIPINPRAQQFYFLDRLFDIQTVWQKEDSIFRKGLLGGEIVNYLIKNESSFISPETGKISMVRADDPLAGEVIQVDNQVLKQVSSIQVFGQLIILGLWLLGIISAIVFGLVWAIRYWAGKIPGGSNIWIRLWPLITCLIFLAIVVAFMIGSGSPFDLLGKVSFISISILLGTICFALTAVWSLFYIIKKRRTTMNKTIYWHSAILAGLNLIVTFYLLWHGVIGIQIWN